MVQSTDKSSKPFLEIESPLDGSLYQKDSVTSEKIQKIALKYSTNVPYDSVEWIVDGTAVKESLLSLTP